MKYLVYISAILFLIGCNNKKIEITTEYIINEKWDKQGERTFGNSINISRMQLKKDSVLDINNLDRMDIPDRLKVDSSFVYFANVKIPEKENYKDKKIFFNKDNGFYWSNDNGEIRTSVIGNLQIGTWYKFSTLTQWLDYTYIYVDSFKNVHRYDFDARNF